MHFLIYEWGSYLQYDVKQICCDKGIKTTLFSWKFKDKNNDEEFESWFCKSYSGNEYDALFSVNYWPLLSVVAQKQGLRYIAWCYDNPLNVVDIEQTLGNPVNRVIMFDKVQANKYISAGFDTVYYHPLCINTKRYGQISVSDEERKKYSADVSFVGSLYESRLQDIKGLVDDYAKGYIDALIATQQEIYGYYLIDDMITASFVSDINNKILDNYPNTDFRIKKEALTFAMASEVTRRDRIMLLTILGRRFNTKLFSYHNHSILEGIEICSPVDYIGEMPKVFKCSKVNLNISLRCIQSGIPLRALDIMGCGAFLLSNYQSEIAENFVVDEEVVLYESIEDAFEKVLFYMEHEDVRERIALAGKKKVFESFSLHDFWNEVIRLAED